MNICLQEHERVVKEKDNQLGQLKAENEQLRTDLASVQVEKAKVTERGNVNEENNLILSRFAREKDLLLFEHDQDRTAYQTLLKEYHELEQRNEMLEQKLAICVPGHSRSLSDASSGSGPVAPELHQDDQNIVSLMILSLLEMIQLEFVFIQKKKKNIYRILVTVR